MRPHRIEPKPGQESVWDYPRPPRLEPSDDEVLVEANGLTIARSTSSLRVLETSQPPAYYVPRSDIDMDALSPALGRSYCEWKGEASYFDISAGGELIEQACWTYEAPTPTFVDLAGYVAFYAQKLDCFLAGEAVVSNEGTFYGGWITSKVVGPFKGGPGSTWW